MKTLFPIPGFLLLFFSLQGCAPLASSEDLPDASSCAGGKALIGVFDGFLRNLCGCQEPTGTFGTQDAPLTCTITRGNQVYFEFIGTQLFHQIVPTGTPSLAASSIMDPADSLSPAFHSVELSVPGTYTFQDAFNNAVSGRIIVQ